MISLASEIERHWQVLLLLLLVLFTYKTVRYLKYYRLSQKWGTEPCKSFSTSALVRTRQMRKAAKEGRLFQYNEAQFAKEDAHTLHMRLFTQNIYMTKNPENIKWVLSKQNKDWDLGPRSKAFEPVLGHGIFVSNGARWEVSRNLLKPQFSRDQISHVRMLEPHVRHMASHIRNHQKGSFDIQPLFHQLTMDASSEFLFGESINSLSFDESNVTEANRQKFAFDSAIRFIQEYLIKRVNLLNLCWLLNSSEFRKQVRIVHEFTGSIIEKAKQKAADPDSEKHTNYVLLHELLHQTSDQDILRDETLNIMLAGRSTTASLLSSLFYELSRNPEVWEKLKCEIVQHFGSGRSQGELDDITFEKLARCLYLKYVVNETLRMHPPVPQNARRAITDTTLPCGGGKDGSSPVLIRKGDIVAFQLHSMHRSAEHYGEDAHVFRPERWADLSQVKSAFLPFGTGPRVCLGQKYALTEASYILVRLAQLFPLLEATGPRTHPPLMRSTTTMSYMDGVHVSMWDGGY